MVLFVVVVDDDGKDDDTFISRPAQCTSTHSDTHGGQPGEPTMIA